MSRRHRGTIYQRRRKQALERDGYQCKAAPGCSQIDLTVHHVRPLCEGGGMELSNLVTVCEPHHRLIHRLWG